MTAKLDRKESLILGNYLERFLSFSSKTSLSCRIYFLLLFQFAESRFTLMLHREFNCFSLRVVQYLWFQDCAAHWATVKTLILELISKAFCIQRRPFFPSFGFFFFLASALQLKPVILPWIMMHKMPRLGIFLINLSSFSFASTTETVTSESLFYSFHIMLLNLLSASLFLFAFCRRSMWFQPVLAC